MIPELAVWAVEVTERREEEMQAETRPSLLKYEVYLTSEQFSRMRAVDAEWVGTDHYMGLAYFWAYEYRFHLRNATAHQRVRVHRALLTAGLPVDGESREHLAIVDRIAPIR